MEKGVIGGRATLVMKNNFVFQLDNEKFEESSIYFDYTYRPGDYDGDDDEESDQFENEEDKEEEDEGGPMISEGFSNTPPPDIGTPGFRERIKIKIEEARVFIQKVIEVFMSPGSQELAIFDAKKERLWQTYVFYSERIPELYDYFEDQMYSGDGDTNIKEFILK